MRFIPVNERELYLRELPDRGLVIQGEIPGCGRDCYINLSQILFEYAVSCEDCKDHIISAEMELEFAQHLSHVLAARVESLFHGVPTAGRIEEIGAIVLRSMDVSYSVSGEEGVLMFLLDECPLRKAAVDPGYSLQISVVHLGFTGLLASIVEELAPGWRLVRPEVEESDTPIQVIRFEGT